VLPGRGPHVNLTVQRPPFADQSPSPGRRDGLRLGVPVHHGAEQGMRSPRPPPVVMEHLRGLTADAQPGRHVGPVAERRGEHYDPVVCGARRPVQEPERRFEDPSALRVADQVRLVDHVKRVFVEHPVRLEPEVRGQLLGGHDHRGGACGQRQAERPGVLGPAGDHGQAPVKVSPELTPEAVGGDNDAGRAGAARHVCRHDVLRHQRLARTGGERQDESPHRGIERVHRAGEELELRRPQG
jgi:hypothetical protein